MTQISASILWYRDFYDVPRLFGIRVEEGYVVFDCQFDDERDEYPPTYKVLFIATSAALTEDDILSRLSGVSPIAEVAVTDVVFDETRRANVRMPGMLRSFIPTRGKGS